MYLNEHKMDYGKFIISEIKDRKSQKGLHRAVWNFLMFPMTLIMNFISYRKWIKLLDRLGLDDAELQEQVQINVKEKKVSFRDIFKKNGETQPSLKINECYLVQKDELFIFPYHKPKTKHHFYTEIQEPIIISFSKSKHPYQTLWKVPTLTKIQDMRYEKSMTTIDLKGEIFDNDIELEFNKKLHLPTAYLTHGEESDMS